MTTLPTRRIGLNLVSLSIACTLAANAWGAATVFRNVRVFDGTALLPETTVLIVDGLVAGVGSVDVPAGAVEVDGRGKLLLPGLIDSHVHSFMPSVQQEALRFGVTTQLDMFSNAALLPQFKRARESLQPTDLADIFSAGILVTAPKGHGTQFGMPIPTLSAGAEAAAFVNARIAEGSDFIKLVLEDGAAFNGQLRFGKLDGSAFASAVDAAHRSGKLAVVHVSSEADAIEALKANADGLAHSFFDRASGDTFVNLARERKAFVVATLTVNAAIAGARPGSGLLADPNLKPFVLPTQSAALTASFVGLAPIGNALTHSSETIRKLNAAGVQVLAGTDAGNPGTAHGISLHGELELLVKAGLTPTEALRSATSGPARAFKLADRGVIAAGKRADLVLVEGDPTTRIQDTRRIVGIWKNGQMIKREPTPPRRAAPKAPEGNPISEFEPGQTSRYGRWDVTTDALQGGKSTATAGVVAGGANGSAMALRVQGTVADGPIVWSGAMFAPGTPLFSPMDFSDRKELSIWLRGDGRTYQIMLFAGDSMQTAAPRARFVRTVKDEWQHHRIPLDQFAGVDLTRILAVAVVAGAPAGPFEVSIDSFGMQ